MNPSMPAGARPTDGPCSGLGFSDEFGFGGDKIMPCRAQTTQAQQTKKMQVHQYCSVSAAIAAKPIANSAAHPAAYPTTPSCHRQRAMPQQVDQGNKSMGKGLEPFLPMRAAAVRLESLGTEQKEGIPTLTPQEL
jgi:hypothetical protein